MVKRLVDYKPEDLPAGKAHQDFSDEMIRKYVDPDAPAAKGALNPDGSKKLIEFHLGRPLVGWVFDKMSDDEKAKWAALQEKAKAEAADLAAKITEAKKAKKSAAA